MLRLFLPALLLLLAACAAPPRLAFTADEQAAAQIAGIPEARQWIDAPLDTYLPGLSNALPAGRGKSAYLAISGGGGDGAFGAGLLAGWSETGTRPEFDVVSGVSTGALIAPFAFLGPDYDATLREVYTSGFAATLLDAFDIEQALFGAGLFSNRKLHDLVRQYVTPQVLARIAAEHAKGRRLLVVTTNLDAGRGVVWDMGAIASSRHPQALALFREVLTASASIPALFPPVMIEVEGKGRRFKEMHVDGTIATPVFTIPPALMVADKQLGPSRRNLTLYMLLNSRIDPPFETTPSSVISVSARAFSTVTRYQSRTALAGTWAFAKREGFRLELAAIDHDIPNDGGPTGFDTKYMRTLYDLGLKRGRGGSAWRHADAEALQPAE